MFYIPTDYFFYFGAKRQNNLRCLTKGRLTHPLAFQANALARNKGPR